MKEIIIQKKRLSPGIRICIEESRSPGTTDEQHEENLRRDASDLADALIDNIPDETIACLLPLLDQYVNKRPIGWEKVRLSIAEVDEGAAAAADETLRREVLGKFVAPVEGVFPISSLVACNDPCHSLPVHDLSTSPPGGQCPTCEQFVAQVSGEFLVRERQPFEYLSPDLPLPSAEDSSIGQDLRPMMKHERELDAFAKKHMGMTEAPIMAADHDWRERVDRAQVDHQQMIANRRSARGRGEQVLYNPPAKRAPITRDQAMILMEKHFPRGKMNDLTRVQFSAVLDVIIEAHSGGAYTNQLIEESINGPAKRVPLTEEKATEFLKKVGREKTPLSSSQVDEIIDKPSLLWVSRIAVLAIIEASK